jgi:hypothetical protein
MKKITNQKLLKAMICLLGGWFLGGAEFFVFSTIRNFSARSKYIPAVFTVGLVIMVALYIIYWSKAKKDQNLNGMRIVMMIVGAVLGMVCLVVTYLIFSNSMSNRFVTIATVVEGVLLIVGQILAYILGNVRIGK